MTGNAQDESPSGQPQRGAVAVPSVDDAVLVAAILKNSNAPAPKPTPAERPSRVFRPPNAGDVIVSPHTGRSYSIQHRIGEGSFSYVFGAVDDWRNECAVKVLKPNGASYEQISQAALHEAGNLFSCRHPHITYVFDAFEYNDTFYIVSERSGFPVADLFLGEFFEQPPQIWARPLARCLLHALSFLHNLGYVHQDVHMNNVFVHLAKSELAPKLQGNVTFKLGDLGLAKPVGKLNPTNTILADWMLPPEYLHAQFGPMDHRLDLYHAGLVLLQLLTGKPLRLTRDQVLAGVPREMAEQLQHPLAPAVAIALRRHVDARPASALAFWRLIQSAMPLEMTDGTA